MSDYDRDTGEIIDGEVLKNEGEPVVKRGRVRTTFGAYLDKLLSKRQRPDGSEIPDPVPTAPPLGYRRQPSMLEHVQRMVQEEYKRVQAERANEEIESPEEADDFEVDDDFEPISAYEYERIFDPLRAEDRPSGQDDRPEDPPPADPAAPPSAPSVASS